MNKALIGIDHGHPSHLHDTGTLIGDWRTEAEWTHEQAKDLTLLLQARGLAATMLFPDLRVASLAARASRAAMLGTRLNISLHVNANADDRVDGLMTFHLAPEAGRVGDEIMKAWDGVGHYVDPGDGRVRVRGPRSSLAKAKDADGKPHWKAKAYNVLSPYTAPTVLVECLFASNYGDRQRLKDPSERAKINNAICAAVEAWAGRFTAGE